MLELGFEGKRSSLRGKLEKGPDRVNSGEGLRLKLWKWGRRQSLRLGQKIRCQWRKQAGAAGASGASSARKAIVQTSMGA